MGFEFSYRLAGGPEPTVNKKWTVASGETGIKKGVAVKLVDGQVAVASADDGDILGVAMGAVEDGQVEVMVATGDLVFRADIADTPAASDIGKTFAIGAGGDSVGAADEGGACKLYALGNGKAYVIFTKRAF